MDAEQRDKGVTPGPTPGVTTVSFPALGKFGRLGNQLFQIAATIGHARRCGARVVLPLWEYSHAFQVPESWFHRRLMVGQEYWEPRFGYETIPPPPAGGSQSLMGYFQSHRYWDREVAEMLRPRVVVSVPPDTIGVHVRRGDYLKLPDHHPVPSKAWLREAVRAVPGSSVRFFSDDPAWCDQHGGDIADGRPWSVSRDTEVRDLSAMAACGSLVMANSSLSWWGAYLGGPRPIVYPRQWFGPALTDAGHTIDDLVLPEWRGM